MRPLREKGPMDKTAETEFGVRQLQRRPSPVVEATGSAISFAQLSVDNFALGTGGANIDFSSIDTTFDASNRFDLTGGGDLQINGAGIYALHFHSFGIAITTAKNCQLFVDIDVTSGTNGLWSGGTAGADMTGTFGANITTPGTDIEAGGDQGIHAFAAWATSATFPVVIRAFAQYTEDGSGVSKSPDFRFTAVRLGDGDE